MTALKVRPEVVETLQSAGATRLMSPGLGGALEHFAHPQVLAEGQVNIIALDAIVERFGSRWALRRESVHSHVDAALSRQLGTAGYHLRITETDVLVCQPELSRLAGQAACLRYLREILSHFLGENQLADVSVHEVLSLSEDGVEARRIDPRAAQAGALQERSRALGDPGAGHREPGEAFAPNAADHWTPFVSATGLRIRVSCALEPVVELKRRSRIGLRFVRQVVRADTSRPLSPAEAARLSGSDLLRIDLATIARGLEGLGTGEGGAAEPSLLIPVSSASLSGLQGRARIVAAFKAAGSRVKQGLICELADVEGLPASVVLDQASSIRPFALLVVGRAGASLPALRSLKGAGLQGVALEAPSGASDTEFAGWIRQSVPTAKSVARSVLVYGVSSARQIAIAEASGATHVSLSRAARRVVS
jgi:hypothetical protein